MRISYKPTFIKSLKKLEVDLQEEVFEKIELFKDTNNHKQLKVHKLRGKLKDYYSFSVNYKYRVVFTFEGNNNADFKDISSHDIYK